MENLNVFLMVIRSEANWIIHILSAINCRFLGAEFPLDLMLGLQLRLLDFSGPFWLRRNTLRVRK
jgi:hypothetical protein